MSVPVSLLRCEDYHYDEVRGILLQSIENIGGLGRYIKPGEKVLLKANLLSRKKPQDAVTTHPVIVQALAAILIEHGASVVIGDSPGGPFTAAFLNGVYKTTGMEAAALATGATLNRNYGSYNKENPRGLIMKRLTITDMVNDVDKIITVAKLKMHGMMIYTGAVKNMFGVVPGIAKAEYHLNIPEYDAFADALIDVCLAAEPVLSFIDGIVGMEGNGPAAGTPVSTKAVFASPSPYHIDWVACKLIGLETDGVPILKRMAARGMIAGDGSDITLKGETIESFKQKEYDRPESFGAMNLTNARIPGFVRKFIAKYVQTRPVFNNKMCNGCKVCLENCPAKIMTLDEKSKAMVDYAVCIRCYCCQELCPQRAITIHRPGLSRLMRL
jgi:uncharacterized protein (DUF362 family)/Pyruvate/2-oxoacid:ferredoxin oxidoreductase delta subunit